MKQQIEEDVKTAMRTKNRERLATLRLIMAAIKQREVDERIVLDDTQIFTELNRMIKQRRDSIAQFQAAQRQELADKEAAEISVIQNYLPAALSEAALDALIHESLALSGATAPHDMGKVMAILKPKIQGRADMSVASRKVKELLNLN